MTPWTLRPLFAWAMLALVFSLALGAPASAQPSDTSQARGTPADSAPASPAPTEAINQGHGWMTIRDDRDQSTILLHLPPRVPGVDEPGTVRIAPGVSHTVDAMASEGDRVWIALTPERGVGGMMRRVVTLSAARSVGGAWGYPPGRPEVLPPLSGRDELVGLAATSRGPVALTRARAEGGAAPAATDWQLRLLATTDWVDLPTPWPTDEAMPPAGSTVRIVGIGAELAIMVFPARSAAYTVHRAVPPIPPAPAAAAASTEESSRLAMDWSTEQWSIDGLSRPEGSVLAPDAVYAVGIGASRQLVAASWMSEGTLELLALRPSGVTKLRDVENVPREHRLAALGDTRSIAVLWWEVAQPASSEATDRPAKEPTPGSTAARRFFIVEVSAISGKELYRGPAEGGGLALGSEFQILAIVLLVLTAAVLLFALRAEPIASLQLPGRFVMADPIRRIFAAAADLVPGILIAAYSMGLDPEAMLSPMIFLGPRAEPMAWLAALAFTMMHCTIGEAFTGRTIGKALTGCEVASIRRDPETGSVELGPVRFWQALVRNIFRWGVPVLGILLLIDGGRRHPADAAAKTIVVVRLPDLEEDD